MSQPKKNRRLCETLKLSKGYQVCSLEKDKHSKVKSKSKKSTPNTFSMIKFYQSIPSNVSNSIFFSYQQLRSNVIDIKLFSATDYDDVRHLPEYDFSERVQLLKKVHCDLSGPLLYGNCKRPVSSTSRCSKRKTSAKKKKCSTSRKTAVSPSLCNVSLFSKLFFQALSLHLGGRKSEHFKICFECIVASKYEI